MKLNTKSTIIYGIAVLMLGYSSYFIYNLLYGNKQNPVSTSEPKSLIDPQNGTNETALNNEYGASDGLMGNQNDTAHKHKKEISKEKSKVTVPKNKESTFSYKQTPETYVGSARAENFAGPQNMNRGIAENYNFPSNLAMNKWALQGRWLIKEEKIMPASPHALIKLHFNAERVYVVANSTNAKSITVHVLLNGSPITESKGIDVKDSQLVVKRQRLYEIVHYARPTSGEVTLMVAPEVELYSFTFG